jgi:ribosome-interacting GTPase 1
MIKRNNNMKIELRNIDLSEVNTLEQIAKVVEEEKEFIKAIIALDKENAIEEFYDNIQAKIGLLEKIFKISANEISEQYYKHLEKIKNRPRKEVKQ